jgi:hypothetical protein
VYKGHVRKSGACPEDDAAGQSILFTNDRRVVARERQNVYVHFKVKNKFLSKEELPVYIHVQCQKRPTTVSKETYYSVKRDLSKEELPVYIHVRILFRNDRRAVARERQDVYVHFSVVNNLCN